MLVIYIVDYLLWIAACY